MRWLPLGGQLGEGTETRRCSGSPGPSAVAGRGIVGVLRERRSFDFHPGVHGKRLEDDLHVDAVPGPPEAQRTRRAVLRGQLPQPEQVPLVGELTGALRLLRLSLRDALSGRALWNGDGEGCEE